MNKLVYFLMSIGLMTGALSCRNGGEGKSEDGLAAFNKDSLTQRIITLSSDEFQGRRPFTKGEEKTVDYLSRSFAALGLEPGNGSSYFQEVPMMEITSDGEPAMTVSSAKGKVVLKKMDDYVIWTEGTDSMVSLKKDELIFAGYGIVAPEYQWNDYAGIDVKGKVVLVMVNDPGFDSNDTTLFKGTRMTYYGRWTYKFEEASRQGAKGCLIVHTTAAASYPFDVVRNSWGTGQIHLDPRGLTGYRCPVEGWLTIDATRKLLSVAGKDTTLLTKAGERGFKPVPLGVTLTTSIKAKPIFNTSKNVIAKITGTRKPDEFVIYTAHWDHFGIGKPENGDSIYNGAYDNATGTAALLEIARAFKSMKTPPERTILFLSVTAEEQGLLGSSYYAQHPVYPIEKTVANINIDGVNIVGPMKDIAITGAGQSELEDYLTEEAQRAGRYISPETHPEAGHYFRSDHFNFAKVGVPALTTGSGIDHVAKGKEYGQQREDEYTEKYYHRPSDEYDPARWDLDGAMDDIKLLFNVGKRLSSQPAWPKWKPASEFHSLRP